MTLRNWIVVALLLLTCNVLTSFAQDGSIAELCKCTLESTESIVVYEEPIISQKVSGKILSVSDKEIEGAIVAITDKDYERVFTFSKTNSNGEFIFKNSESTDYYLMICKPGFNPLQFIIRLKPANKGKSDIILRLSPM